jgi:hypothetical protein
MGFIDLIRFLKVVTNMQSSFFIKNGLILLLKTWILSYLVNIKLSLATDIGIVIY